MGDSDFRPCPEADGPRSLSDIMELASFGRLSFFLLSPFRFRYVTLQRGKNNYEVIQRAHRKHSIKNLTFSVLAKLVNVFAAGRGPSSEPSLFSTDSD